MSYRSTHEHIPSSFRIRQHSPRERGLRRCSRSRSRDRRGHGLRDSDPVVSHTAHQGHATSASAHQSVSHVHISQPQYYPPYVHSSPSHNHAPVMYTPVNVDGSAVYYGTASGAVAPTASGAVAPTASGAVAPTTHSAPAQNELATLRTIVLDMQTNNVRMNESNASLIAQMQHMHGRITVLEQHVSSLVDVNTRMHADANANQLRQNEINMLAFQEIAKVQSQAAKAEISVLALHDWLRLVEGKLIYSEHHRLRCDAFLRAAFPKVSDPSSPRSSPPPQIPYTAEYIDSVVASSPTEVRSHFNRNKQSLFDLVVSALRKVQHDPRVAFADIRSRLVATGTPQPEPTAASTIATASAGTTAAATSSPPLTSESSSSHHMTVCVADPQGNMRTESVALYSPSGAATSVASPAHHAPPMYNPSILPNTSYYPTPPSYAPSR